MSIIGEAILTITVEKLVEKLASEQIQQFARQEKIQGGLKKWKVVLETSKVVLDDAEEKQITNPLVKTWLAKLQNLAYDVEDILDDFATEALRRKLLLLQQQANDQPNKMKLRMPIPTCCTKFSPPCVKSDYMIRYRIEEITARFEEIVKQKDQLHLNEVSGGRIRYRSVQDRPSSSSTSSLMDTAVYGRENDRDAIVEMLVRIDDSSSQDVFSVISITGTGGLGKTTLAQLVYNNDKVDRCFDFKAWVYVSKDFDPVRITKAILADERDDDLNNLNLLQVQLKDKLQKKKFLLVLDDMWSQNYDDWTILCGPFEAGLPGSKIIITTRNQDVSSMVTTTGAVYSLRNLSNDECLPIFAQQSLGKKNFSEHLYLREIGEKIVGKCNGLPLAAKTLGGLLRGKYDPDDWKQVLSSKIWDLQDDDDDDDESSLMRALMVSYYFLPSYLKQCFAYCSMLPKGYEFQERQIILLWLAEGLLEHEKDDMKMEELGCKAFRDLLSMTFFQQSKTDVSRFLMHDLIHDLACSVSGEICSEMKSLSNGFDRQEFSINLRHFAYISDRFVGYARVAGLHKVKQLRTFLPLPVTTRKEMYVTNGLLSHILPKLQRLRVVSLWCYQIFELPDKIRELRHLRYLDLSYSAIQVLPESVSTLYNLQTLILEYCNRLKKLFLDIGNLINLRHLKNSHSNLLEGMPLRIGKLTDLRTLAKFVVGKNNCSGLKELRSLTHLQEQLTISRLENVNDPDHAKEAELDGKEKLNVLALEWSSNSSGNSWETGEIQNRVLEMLKPHYEGLKELTIQGYGGTKFPAWLGQPSFLNLVQLRFEDCRQCTSLPSVGQLPSLKDLIIKGLTEVKSVGQEFLGTYGLEPFPSLERLCFEDMQELEEWISVGDQQTEGFPCLMELSIIRCSKLKGRLPQRFPSLDRIIINSCERLFVSYTTLPALCEVNIDGFNEVAWISYPDNDSSFGPMVVSDTPSLAKPLSDDLHKLGHITNIELFHSYLFSFPESGLPTNLRELSICSCRYLKALSNGMNNLFSLEKLEVRRCPAITSIPDKDGLPRNVKLLKIEGPNICKLFLDLGLYNFPSLGELLIEDGLDNCETFRVPNSLAKLDIRKFPNLRSLSFVRRLISLERLELSRCPRLEYSHEICLPPLLLMLEIYLCPLLKKSCKKDGESWHMIAHIPYVRIDHRFVFDHPASY